MRTCAREENCWRNAAAERLVEPAEIARASRTAIEVPPFSERNHAEAPPTAPAPMTTTSARRGRFGGRGAMRRAAVRLAGALHAGPVPEATARERTGGRRDPQRRVTRRGVGPARDEGGGRARR